VLGRRARHSFPNKDGRYRPRVGRISDVLKVGIGGIADVSGWGASANLVEIDPKPTWARQKLLNVPTA
jgi:hypothetical protein